MLIAGMLWIECRQSINIGLIIIIVFASWTYVGVIHLLAQAPQESSAFGSNIVFLLLVCYFFLLF